MDISYLQFLLYVLGAVLLGALIVLVIKVVYSLTHDEVTLQYIQAGEKAIQSKRAR